MTSLPDVPTIAETLPGFESAAWFAVVAPPGRRSRSSRRSMPTSTRPCATRVLAKRMAGMSAEIVGGSTQEQTARYFRSEVDRWHKVIKAANVKME